MFYGVTCVSDGARVGGVAVGRQDGVGFDGLSIRNQTLRPQQLLTLASATSHVLVTPEGARKMVNQFTYHLNNSWPFYNQLFLVYGSARDENAGIVEHIR